MYSFPVSSQKDENLAYNIWLDKKRHSLCLTLVGNHKVGMIIHLVYVEFGNTKVILCLSDYLFVL